MKNSIVNVDRRIYLVKFKHTISGGTFISENVADIIKNHDNAMGIEFIKVFDRSKHSFKRISRSDILRFHSFCAESTEILKSHSYFK